jgi:pilus assembly protein CpaB
VVAGGCLTAGVSQGSTSEHSGGGGVARGWRAVVVEVSGAAGLVEGSRVDVLVSTESGVGGGRTLVALAGAELLRLGAAVPDAAPADGSAPAGPTALATLRVTLGQAVYLTAADNFAREIRLLARPPGDRSRAGAAISQGQL